MLRKNEGEFLKPRPLFLFPLSLSLFFWTPMWDTEYITYWVTVPDQSDLLINDPKHSLSQTHKGLEH